jgi:hypothetical protein
VTWILQKEKHAFKDFGWYEEWVEKAKQDSLLRWLKETRNTLVKQQALQTESSLEVVCVGNPRSSHDSDDDEEEEEEEPFRMRVSPFRCTHYYIFTAPSEDHGHEFIRFWGIDNLKGRELLAGC